MDLRIPRCLDCALANDQVHTPRMKNYYRVMLGRGSAHARVAREGGFIGADFDIQQDLSQHLPDNWREFNGQFIPIFLEKHPEKSKIAAGLACGMLHTVAKGISVGDVVLCPDGQGEYFVGEVSGQYEYHPGQPLPHRRRVQWFTRTIKREEMGDALRHSAGSIGTVSDISAYAEELERLIAGNRPPSIVATDETIEDPSVFALEKHLEDFLVHNWPMTELGRMYDLFKDEENSGQQYPSDTGPIDILAVSKDKKIIAVIELKKGRASDVVVGQVQRYMGFVQDELAEPGQSVHGIIIALEDDTRIRRALSVAPNIDFYTYTISFKLEKKI